jgi:hypothetical protein
MPSPPGYPFLIRLSQHKSKRVSPDTDPHSSCSASNECCPVQNRRANKSKAACASTPWYGGFPARGSKSSAQDHFCESDWPTYDARWAKNNSGILDRRQQLAISRSFWQPRDPVSGMLLSIGFHVSTNFTYCTTGNWLPDADIELPKSRLSISRRVKAHYWDKSRDRVRRSD